MAIGCQPVTVSAPVTSWQRGGVRDWNDTSPGERLEHVLTLRRLTLGALARLTGLSKATISRLKSGDRAEGATSSWRAIATATKVDLEWLLSGAGQAEEPIDTEALPNNLRELVDGAELGTYSTAEVKQAAMYRDLRGRDLPPSLWHEYILGLRREAKLIDVELAAARPRVVQDDPVEAKKAARKKKRS